MHILYLEELPTSLVILLLVVFSCLGLYPLHWFAKCESNQTWWNLCTDVLPLPQKVDLIMSNLIQWIISISTRLPWKYNLSFVINNMKQESIGAILGTRMEIETHSNFNRKFRHSIVCLAVQIKCIKLHPTKSHKSMHESLSQCKDFIVYVIRRFIIWLHIYHKKTCIYVLVTILAHAHVNKQNHIKCD